MTTGPEIAPPRPRIWVISAGALERFVPALGAMGAIRAYHEDAEIVLLTARGSSAFATTAPYFDQVWVDETDGAGSPKLRCRGRAISPARRWLTQTFGAKPCTSPTVGPHS